MKDDWKERGLKLEVKFHKEPLQKLKKQNQKQKIGVKLKCKAYF